MSLAAFLRYYEQAHQNRANRAMHHLAHAVGAVGVLLLWRPLLGLPLVVGAFLLSWAGHFAFERNTPAFFDPAASSGVGAAVAKKLEVALGGMVWSGACLLRLFGAGPLADDHRPGSARE